MTKSLYRIGTTKSVRTPDVVRPATSVIARGCHVPGTRARGTFPRMVTKDVRKTGSNRERPASKIASEIESPVLRLRLILSIRTMELLITIPKSATNQISEGNESVERVKVSHKKTPISESGIGTSTKRDCL